MADEQNGVLSVVGGRLGGKNTAMVDDLTRYIRRWAEIERDALEDACRQAAVSDRGVRVVRDPATSEVTITVTSKVPARTIYYFEHGWSGCDEDD